MSRWAKKTNQKKHKQNKTKKHAAEINSKPIEVWIEKAGVFYF